MDIGTGMLIAIGLGVYLIGCAIIGGLFWPEGDDPDREFIVIISAFVWPLFAALSLIMAPIVGATLIGKTLIKRRTR